MYVPAEWVQSPNSIVPLSGYESSKPMLFASVYPVDSVELEALFAAVDRLCLNDSSITVTRDHSVSLGYTIRLSVSLRLLLHLDNEPCVYVVLNCVYWQSWAALRVPRLSAHGSVQSAIEGRVQHGHSYDDSVRAVYHKL